MKKWLLIIPVLFLVGCCTIPSTPNLPSITIEKPPQLSDVEWVLITINGIPYYSVNSKDALKVYIDRQKTDEYMNRCYDLIMPEMPK